MVCLKIDRTYIGQSIGKTCQISWETSLSMNPHVRLLVGSLFCWSDIEAANAMIPMKSDELSMSRFVSPADKSRSSMMSWSAGVSFDLYMSLSHSYYLKI